MGAPDLVCLWRRLLAEREPLCNQLTMLTFPLFGRGSARFRTDKGACGSKNRGSLLLLVTLPALGLPGLFRQLGTSSSSNLCSILSSLELATELGQRSPEKTMTHPIHRTFASLLVLAIALAGASSASAQDWRTYSNARYGFSLQYPGDIFAVERTAEAGDGQLFVAKNGGARLLGGTLTNDTGFTPRSYQTYVAKNSYAGYRISYRRLGGNWFVLSGEGDGKIFYEKAMFSCAGRLINSFAIIYPSHQRGVFDRIVERVEDSFRPGRRC
jgi:hypothetical protein